MSCKSVQAKLSAYLDGEMSGSEMKLIRGHVNSCKACEHELDSLKSVQMILRGLPACSEPSAILPSSIMQGLVKTRRNYVRLGVFVVVPAIIVATVLFSRPTPSKTQDRNLAIKSQVASDQIFDAGTDSTSGASLVHYANFESR